MIRLLLAIACSISGMAFAAEDKVDCSNADEVSKKVKRYYDEFKKQTKFEGPNCATTLFDIAMLRAWDFGANVRGYQIYFSDYYEDYGWRDYNNAYDIDGNPLVTKRIEHDILRCSRRKCSYSETIGMTVPLEYLEKRRTRGLEIKVYGKAGTEVVKLPATYVDAFLRTIK
ncbi:MAG: hypothetical protein H7A16_09605 [Sinobacteraceae bacterium]|nr:hypothetical protein [Nevskiaceae bacterium]